MSLGSCETGTRTSFPIHQVKLEPVHLDNLDTEILHGADECLVGSLPDVFIGPDRGAQIRCHVRRARCYWDLGSGGGGSVWNGRHVFVTLVEDTGRKTQPQRHILTWLAWCKRSDRVRPIRSTVVTRLANDSQSDLGLSFLVLRPRPPRTDSH